MSTAEPFMPAHEPRDTAAPTDHDIDRDVDVVPDDSGSDPAADAAAEKEWDGKPTPSFRTPRANVRLSAEELERDLRSESD